MNLLYQLFYIQFLSKQVYYSVHTLTWIAVIYNIF